ncbi:chemotaxis protein CheW [Iningainema tapete]|uniref:Chemotaxis protein CheW n=1 Tax=Iningainema tapete BLCC-T55 TaxID=2748662 RepID=A0A8J7BYM2_9CYAN|nr:chemotaxis protein CheW [Iningainema tapete]MBD2775997.1 chemotaxis protein CheW [Iningainema tapete BLCC-T55]
MNQDFYLTFRLNNRLYGISTVYVEEIFSLPDLIPISTASPDSINTINLQGDILPVMDLNLSLGYQLQEYSLTDSIVVFRWEELRVGIIVNEIREVINVTTQEIHTEFYEEQAIIKQNKIIAGVAKNLEDIFILNHPGYWLPIVSNSLEQETQTSYDVDTLAQTILPAQTNHLALSTYSQDTQSLRPLTVFILNDDFFGIDLKMVREFTDIRKVTPVPCCPAHIIGNMNLRGEIITLVDIRRLLNIQPTNMHDSKVIIVEFESIVAGLVVEKVCDVMFFLNPLNITEIISSLYSINKTYLQGTTPYQGKMMSILDLPKIFHHGGLTVNEAV